MSGHGILAEPRGLHLWRGESISPEDAESLIRYADVEVQPIGHHDHRQLAKNRKTLDRSLPHSLDRLLDRLNGTSEAAHGEVEEKGTSETASYPEVDWDAELRRSNEIHPAEIEYLVTRRRRIATSGGLARFLGLPPGEEVHPDDVPIIGFGGSGGGYRAHLAFVATFQAAKEHGFWDLLSYVAGVSAACWSIAGYLTFAERNADVLLEHFAANASQHPLSFKAIRAVAESPMGFSFLFGPLIDKAKQGINLTLLDLWSTLSTSYMWLPVEGGPEAGGRKPRLRTEWFQWSKVWERAGIKDGEEPFPILTAVRHVRPWDTHAVRRLLRYLTRFLRSPERKREIDHDSKIHEAWYQWFEFNPLEVGCDELEGWLPAWAYGRKFRNGHSVERRREQSLSLILGVVTSAPAAPLSIHLGAIARNLPRNKFGSAIKKLGEEVMRLAPDEAERFGNKHIVNACNEPNPFFSASKKARRGHGIENNARIRLMDAGLGNNMPTQPFLHPGRDVDVLINCDFSSDVQRDTAMQRLKEFGNGRGFTLTERVTLPSLGGPPLDEDGKPKQLSAEQLEERFRGRYAQLMDVVPLYDEQGVPPPEGFYFSNAGPGQQAILYNERHQPQAWRKTIVVYAPLFPNKVHPEFDPATTSCADSYNLVWTPEQVHTIAETQRANIREALPTIRDAIREAYENRKEQRLKRAGRL